MSAYDASASDAAETIRSRKPFWILARASLLIRLRIPATVRFPLLELSQAVRPNERKVDENDYPWCMSESCGYSPAP